MIRNSKGYTPFRGQGLTAYRNGRTMPSQILQHAAKFVNEFSRKIMVEN